MRLLLDTHVLIWWLEGSPRLLARAAEAVSDIAHDVLISAATAWEITTKHRIGKLPGVARYVGDLAAVVSEEGFGFLDVGFAHACLAGRLDGVHRDPFDRILVAQALIEDLVVVSADHALDGFGVSRLW